MIRTRNPEWGVCFYWRSLEEAFENWFAGEVLEVFFEGMWLVWNDHDRILLRK